MSSAAPMIGALRVKIMLYFNITYSKAKSYLSAPLTL